MKKKITSDSAPYMKVVVDEGGEAPEILLYGMIGQDFWWDEKLDEETITDLAFIKEFRRLEREYDTIHIRINSPGGSTGHGIPIVTAIQQSKATIHTWNDGLAASMAADIWLAGDVRHMAQSAKLMIHSTWNIAVGNARDLEREIEVLKKFDESAITMMAEKLGWDKDRVRSEFYDYEDHWLTAEEVLELGMVDSIEGGAQRAGATDPSRTTYADLIRQAMQRPTRDLDMRVNTEALAQAVARAMSGGEEEQPEASPPAENTQPEAEQPENEPQEATGRSVSEAKDTLIELYQQHEA